MNAITFFVPGTPAPGGSKNAFAIRRRDGSIATRRDGAPIINIVDAGKGNREWKRSVAIAARRAMGSRRPMTGGIKLRVEFIFKRPTSHLRADGRLRPSFAAHHGQKPDCLKLLRSTEDAMTGIVYVDDAQVIEISGEKGWGHGVDSGAAITVEEMCPLPIDSARETLFGEKV